jgi:hypothetical protein
MCPQTQSAPGMGMLITLQPLEQNAGWTPATLDIFSDFGSVLHLLYGGMAASVPCDWGFLMFALMAGYEATKAAGGESWQRIGGVWVEFAIGMGAVLAVKHFKKGKR